MATPVIIDVLKSLSEQSNWKWRRWFVFGIAIWAQGLITYIAIVGSDATRDAIAFNITGLLMTLVGSYIFGATWDSQNARKSTIAAHALPAAGGTADTQVKVDT